jgi:hypothetical protein
VSRPFPSPRFTGICLIVAAVLLQIGYLATPWESGEATLTSYHDALAEHPGQSLWAATFLHFGWLVWAPAAFGIVALLSPRGGKLLWIAGTLAIVGTVSLPGLLVSDFYDLALAENLPRAESVELAEKAGEPFQLIAFFQLPAIFGALVGTMLLAFALWRAGVVALWVALLVLVGSVITFLLPPGLAAFGIGGTMTTIGFVFAGVRILQVGDRDLRESPKSAPSDAGAAVAA